MQIKKILKISLYSIISVVLLGVIAIALIVFFVNPNRFKPIIIKTVETSTNRHLQLNGDLAWSIWPNLGLKLNDVSLSNPASFKESDMLQFNSAVVSVKLLPLLENSVSVNELTINGLKLNLLEESSLNNWTFLPETSSSNESSTGEAPQPIKITIDSLKLANSTITYKNLDTKEFYSIESFNLDITTGFNGKVAYNEAKEQLQLKHVSINFDDAIKTKIEFEVNNFSNPNVNGKIDLEQFAINKVLGKIKSSTPIPNEIKVLDGLSFNAEFDTKDDKLKLKDTKFSLKDDLSGSINLQFESYTNPIYSGNINIDNIKLSNLLTKIKFSNPYTDNNKMLNQFKFATKFNGTATSANLTNLSFEFPNYIKGDGNINVKNFSNPSFNGNINIPSANVSNIVNELKIKSLTPYTQNNKMLSQFKLATKFSGTATSANLSNLSFEFPNYIKGNGNINVNNFANPSFSGDMNIPTTNLNTVLNEANIAVKDRKNNTLLNEFSFKGKFNGDTSNLSLQQSEINLAKLLNIKLNSKISNFSNPTIAGDVNISEFSLNTVLDKAGYPRPDIPNKTLLNKVTFISNYIATTNSAKLTNLNANISGSKITGTVNVTSFSPIAMDENINISQINVSDLVDAYGYSLPLTNVNAAGNISIGNSDNYATYNGKQTVHIGNVTVLGFSVDNLAKQLDNALTNTGKALSLTNLQQIAHSTQVINSVENMQRIVANAQVKGKKDYNLKTNLGEFNGNFTMNHGVINPSAYQISGPSLKNSGTGSINMVNDSLNYKVNTQLITPLQNKVLNSIVFPYNVKGPFKNLDGSLDWISIQQQLIQFLIKNYGNDVKNAVKNETQKQVNNIIQQQAPKASQQLQQGAQQLINGIFGK